MSSSTSSSPSKKTVILKSSDGETFEIEEKVAMESQMIKNMIEDDCTDTAIPLPNVTGTILAKVIEYCKRHVVDDVAASKEGVDDDENNNNNKEKKKDVDGLKEFDSDFVKVDNVVLFDLILAANYMNIKNLLDLTCQAVANRIKDKQPEEVRRIFNITNDFTPEEEAEVRRENAWAFE